MPDKKTPAQIFSTEPGIWDLQAGLNLSKWRQGMSKEKLAPPTPALLAIKNNMSLPSCEYQHYDDSSENPSYIAVNAPLKGLRKSINPTYSTVDWAGSFTSLFILPVVNLLWITIATYLEFVIRSAAALFLQPTTYLLNSESENKTPLPLKVLAIAVSSPLWCLGQTLSLVADVISYTKELLDSTMRIVNPLWWGCKIYNLFTGNDTGHPSFKSVATTFASSIVKLLPAAFIIATGILTAGISVPILQGIAAPLQAVGSAIVHAASISAGAAISAATAAAANTFIAIGIMGAVSAVSKVFSGSIGALTKILASPKTSASKTSRMTRTSSTRLDRTHQHDGDNHAINNKLGLSKQALREKAKQQSIELQTLNSPPKPSSPLNVMKNGNEATEIKRDSKFESARGNRTLTK